MPIQICLTKFESSIITVFLLNPSFIAIVTANHEIYLYNTIDNSKKRLLRLNIPDEEKLFCTFNPLNNRLAFGTDRSKVLHLIDLDQKKIIRKFELGEQHPTAVSFDPSGSYLICGTDQGRVLLWRSDSPIQIARLHSFPEYAQYSVIKPQFNFVAAIAFDDNLVMTSGYGGSVVITDYRSQTQTQRLHAGHVKNGALLLYKNNLIVGNQSGAILKIDRDRKSPNQRLSTSLGSITHLLRIGPEPYILAASKQNRIILINVETMSIINDRYIELDDTITTLCKDDKDIIYVGTKKGDFYQFDLQPLHQLDALIKSKQYAKAYHYCHQEPLLQESGSYDFLESIFQKEMQSARLFLEKGELEKAKTVLEPFNPIKLKEITAFIYAYSQINRLNTLFKQQKLSAFYGLIEQHPLLRSTSLFLQAEKMWGACYLQAQKLMLVGKSKECKMELNPYATVDTKRPLIQLLLQNFDLLKECSKAIHEKNYPVLKYLAQRHPIIRKLPSYVQLITEAGELIPTITNMLKIKEFEQAFLLLEELTEVVHYQEDYNRLKTFTSLASNLHHAIEHEHWRSAYRLLDSHRELMILPWAVELEIKWHQKLEQCETHAMNADIPAIRKELYNLINLQGRHERVGDILRTTYHVQLKLILRNNPANFKNGVANYCTIFGIDTELHNLIKTAQAKGIDISLQSIQSQPKNRDQWLSSITILPDHIA